jgi:PAS domain S-box-containing protein
MGDLIVAPLVFVVAALPRPRLSRAALAEALVLLGLLIGVSCVVFLAGWWHYPHLLFPLLVWAALRFRQRGAATASFAVAAIAIAGAVNGTTPVGGTTGTEVVQILEALIAATIVSVLIVGALLAEREEASHDRERVRRALAEAQQVAHIGSWEWEIPGNRVTWSDELYRIYGVEPGTPVTYEAYVERIHPSDRQLARETVGNARETGEPFAYDHRIIRTDGDVRWVHGRGHVVRDESGTPVRMVGTSQDITERKRVDELRDNILATVSHELRTPLTAIIGFTLTLLEKGPSLPDATRSEIVRHLAEQARRLERLLSDLLDLDRLRHGVVRPSFRPTDVGELAARVAETSANGRRVDVRVESVTADVDAPKVERIVENLLVNAVKHTPAGADVRLRVERLDDSVLIAVDDRGPGVPGDEREAIFELFNRGAALPGVAGTGVGLSLVAQFAELHGGRAWVEENPGGGASFRVVLPVHRRA